jgi:hypothetical protein
LLDGHNRLDICQRLKLPYETVAVELASREHALLWIEENQLGRRNLTTDQRAAIALRVMRRKSDIAVREQRRVAGLAGGRGRPKSNSGSDASSDPLLPQAAATPQRLQAGEVVALDHSSIAMVNGITSRNPGRTADPSLSRVAAHDAIDLLPNCK